MKVYDYKEAVYNDCLDFTSESFDKNAYEEKGERYIEELQFAAFISDAVTGNGSGSYWFNAYKAEEAICHNLYLYAEAAKEFCLSPDDFNYSEGMDVTIRCYLFTECFKRAFEDFIANNGCNE